MYNSYPVTKAISLEEFDKPPTNDPTLPSYQCEDYNRMLPWWEFINDMYEGSGNWIIPSVGVTDWEKARRYLPQEIKENDTAYQSRLLRSPYLKKLQQIITGFSGLLSDFTLDESTIPSIEEAQENIDLQGNSLNVFLKEADKRALRDGHSFVLVDYPNDPDRQFLTALDDNLDPSRFYLVLIDAINIPNWDIAWVKGTPRIQHVTVRETQETKDGYGYTTKTVYRVMRPGVHEIYEIVKAGQNKWEAKLLNRYETTIQEVPLIFYSLSSKNYFSSEPPLVNAAQQNLLHYQLMSDYIAIMHSCNLPVPVRKGVLLPGQDIKDAPPMVIGPNSGIDLPSDGDFMFAEPSGGALEATRQAILDVQDTIDRMFLSFISSADSEKTATEVMIQSAQTEANLFGMAELKESNAEQIFDMIAMYEGQENGGTISSNKDILREPVTPEQIALVYEKGIISRETAILRLEEMSIVDDAQAELSKVEAEKEADMEAGMQQMEEQAAIGLDNGDTESKPDSQPIRQFGAKQ